MKHTAFDTYHPLIAAVYLVVTLVFTMAAFQPVFVVLSFVVAVAYNLFLRGWRAELKTMAWQLPLLIIIALLNPVFSASGSTILFKIGHWGFFLESFAYGICMGLALVAVMQWFSNLAHILTSDKLMQLTGSTMPTIGLMITMILRLIPQFMRRSRSVHSAQEVCTAASAGRTEAHGRADKSAENGEKPQLGFFQRRALAIRGTVRDLSVLMGWGMEDSLDTADAMRARGWGAVPKRSTYQRSDFRVRDGILLALMVLLVAISAVAASLACARFTFYPQLAALGLWWGYVPYAVFLVIPFLLELKERALWKA